MRRQVGLTFFCTGSRRLSYERQVTADGKACTCHQKCTAHQTQDTDSGSLLSVLHSDRKLFRKTFNQTSAQSLLSFFWGHLCLFVWGSLMSFFLGSLVFFVVRKQQSRAPALGCRSGFTPFLSLGFRFGLTLFRASAWVSSFLGFRLSFKLAFASFRVLGWVYSVFSMGFLSLGFGLALLLLGLRPGFDRF